MLGMNPLGVWVECDSFHFLLVAFWTINIYHTLGFTTNRSFFPKLFKCKMTYLFQTIIRKLFYGLLVTEIKFEFQLLWVWNFILWYLDVSSFQCRRSDLIWMSQQKVITIIPKPLIFGLSRRENLYCIPCVQCFVSISGTPTTYTLVHILSYESSLTLFGSRIPHIWPFSQEHLFSTSSGTIK